MEARKITVIQTKNQKKSVIMSSATTLEELKRDFSRNGIDYDGMSFFEGVSKTELKVDSSLLPHDVPYKGQVTNELVFMLTNTNKKIKSGATAMSRNEAYSAIKAMNLQEACVNRFGKNFTMCKTADLITLIHDNECIESYPDEAIKDSSEAISENNEEETVEHEVATSTVPTASASNGENNAVTTALAAITRLTQILRENEVIDTDEAEEIFAILSGKVVIITPKSSNDKDSPYSANEINDMFSFLK